MPSRRRARPKPTIGRTSSCSTIVGSDAVEKTREAEADDRTNEQLQYDTIIAVLRTGADADPQQAFGDRQPGVRIVVESAAITAIDERGDTRVTGVGHLEDGGHAVPGGVVEARLCDAGAIPVIWDPDGRPLDVGRQLRLFSRKQRIAIAARDGGCVWPSCSAPISQCEYHHIDHWWDHHGRTDVDDGVPLCRNCHLRLRLHNQR
ncbi:13E12 repeat family protein [Microbacterium sp. LWS13-1.2]|uniref:13E12 repeat family protein n=1 Tax=Microbacterium sp. LWS13-1.2 TaxID=3135264 RepID=A0AAU6SD10_9MICO